MAVPHVTGIIALIMSDRKNDIDGDGRVSRSEVYGLLWKYTKHEGKERYRVLKAR